MHVMWYEAEMVNDTLDSIQAALKQAPGLDVRLKFCINKQTYLEQPQEGTVEEMVSKFIDSLMVHMHITLLVQGKR